LFGAVEKELASIVFVAIMGSAFIALLPIVYIRSVWLRRPWLGLTVTTRSASTYAGTCMVCAVPAGVVAGLALDARAGALAALVIGIAFAYRGSLVLDAANVERVLRAIGEGDRVKAVTRAERAVARLLRFPNLVGVKLSWGIVSLVSGAGLLADAERILSRVPEERYLGAALWCLQHARASLRIRMGRFDDAALSLDSCQGKAPSDALDEEHRYLRAVVDVSTGHVERAQRRMKDADKPEHRHQVAAHVAAALGDQDGARAALERVTKLLYGPTMVEMIANGHGPARTAALRLVGREPQADDDGDVRT
jgi:hypothetical protein